MPRMMSNTGNESDLDFSGRVVVISPHLDDAIMSLGGTIAKAVQGGARVEVLTVFGYVPGSTAPAGPWDSKSGFKTEGDAASSRREEDHQACLELRAEPRWLSFGAEPYERRGTPDEIWSAVDSMTRGADLVLLPGYPLAHPDHAELSQLLLQRGMSCRATALYAEQPYRFYQRKTSSDLSNVPALRPLVGDSLVWTRIATDGAFRGAKLRAVGAYRSQLRQLGLGFFGLRHMLWHEAGQGGEAVAKVAVGSTARA
jgi:LmbE family N-acetylglucosaminyl deacetylase